MGKRYLLKLTKVADSTCDLSGIAEEYFGDYYYDASVMGCWFLTMDDALYARNQLKKENKLAVYDVISYESPWKEAMEKRNAILKLSIPVDEEAPVVDDDAMIAGDNDSDDLAKFLAKTIPTPLATGRSAITIAQAGVGELYFARSNLRIPISLDEAKALVVLCPSDVHVYAKEEQE